MLVPVNIHTIDLCICTSCSSHVITHVIISSMLRVHIKCVFLSLFSFTKNGYIWHFHLSGSVICSSDWGLWKNKFSSFLNKGWRWQFVCASPTLRIKYLMTFGSLFQSLVLDSFVDSELHYPWPSRLAVGLFPSRVWSWRIRQRQIWRLIFVLIFERDYLFWLQNHTSNRLILCLCSNWCLPTCVSKTGISGDERGNNVHLLPPTVAQYLLKCRLHVDMKHRITT